MKKSKDFLRKIIEMFESEGYISALSDISENNISHNNERVWDHVLEVEKSIGIYVNKHSKLFSPIFSQRIGRFTRRELFMISVLFHDLGKMGFGEQEIGKVKVDQDGTTRATSHEYASCLFLHEINKKLSLFNVEELEYLSLVVRTHSGLLNKLIEEYRKNYKYTFVQKLFTKNPIILEILIYQIIENKGINTVKKDMDYLEKMVLDTTFIRRISKKAEQNAHHGWLHYRDSYSFPWTKKQRFRHFVEEAGELGDVLAGYEGYKLPLQSKDDLISSFSDVYSALITLCRDYDIDFQNLELKTLNKIKKQFGYETI